MATVREHYEEVLSQHYARMFGEFEAKVAEQQALLERLGITPGRAAAWRWTSAAAQGSSPSRWRASASGCWPSTSVIALQLR